MPGVTVLNNWTGCRIIVIVVLGIKLDLRGCHSGERKTRLGCRLGVNKLSCYWV